MQFVCQFLEILFFTLDGCLFKKNDIVKINLVL